VSTRTIEPDALVVAGSTQGTALGFEAEDEEHKWPENQNADEPCEFLDRSATETLTRQHHSASDKKDCW
jgi:hypothetical protein